ncbi:MAG: glycosyltransferase family 2 protein [Marmoricola sp.]
MTGVLTLLNTITICMVITFLAYVCFILIPFLRYPRTVPGDPTRFAFHFLIPCRDEEAVIARTIERARRLFPSAHVWVIDDDSDDATATIARSYADVDDAVHLVQRRRPLARTGKGDALNAAYRELDRWLPAGTDRQRVVVTVIDADGELAGNALEIVAADDVFGDPAIGAAQIAVWMKNRDDKTPYPDKGRIANAAANWLVRMQDLEFRTIIASMQALRARTGTVGLGGNGQFTRLSVLDAIGEQYGEPWHGSLLEDYELGVHVLLSGSKIKHVYDTHVSQEGLPSLRRLLTQRTRWAQGNIQCVRYIPQIARSRYFDSAGVLETCYYLVLPFLQITAMLAFAVLTIRSTVIMLTDPTLGTGQLRFAVLLVTLSLMFSVLPFVIWGPVYKRRCEPGTSWPRALLYGVGVWVYVYYMYLCLPRAFVRIAMGRNGWSKTRRNAEEHPAGGATVAIEH